MKKKDYNFRVDLEENLKEYKNVTDYVSYQLEVDIDKYNDDIIKQYNELIKSKDFIEFKIKIGKENIKDEDDYFVKYILFKRFEFSHHEDNILNLSIEDLCEFGNYVINFNRNTFRYTYKKILKKLKNF
jgi:hypothetical protein